MGGRFYLTAKTHTFVPYLGAGVRVSRFEESNVIVTVSEDEISFSGQVGLLLKLKHRLFLDTRILFRYCHIKPEEVEFDIGGMVISAGVKHFFLNLASGKIYISSFILPKNVPVLFIN